VTRASSLGARLGAIAPRSRTLLIAGAGVGALLLATSDSPGLALAGRAALVPIALGLGAGALRRRPAASDRADALAVAGRQALSRDAAVAILEARGRTLLVGYGPDGVRLLADLGAGVRDPGAAP
jgi:hypothetical protein